MMKAVLDKAMTVLGLMTHTVSIQLLMKKKSTLDIAPYFLTINDIYFKFESHVKCGKLYS